MLLYNKSIEKRDGKEMAHYKVKYMVVTKSRCGSYIYKDTTVVDAENEVDAKMYVKSNAGSWHGFKRCSVRIASVVEQ